jgi:hypothetical protein
VVDPGTAAAETVLPRLADSLREVLRQRDELAAQAEEPATNTSNAPFLAAFASLAHPRHGPAITANGPATTMRGGAEITNRLV